VAGQHERGPPLKRNRLR